MYTGCAGYSAFPVFLYQFGVDPISKNKKLPQINIKIERRMNTLVLAFLIIPTPLVPRNFREREREICSKLVEKFVDKTRIWGTWDTLYMCVHIFGYCYVVWTAVLLYWPPFHHGTTRGRLIFISFYDTCSRDRRTRESPNASVSCGSCLLSRRGSTSLSDVHYVRL